MAVFVCLRRDGSAWLLVLFCIPLDCNHSLGVVLLGQVAALVLKLVSIKEIAMNKCTMVIAVTAALLGMTAAQASEFSGAYLGGKVGYNMSSPANNTTVDQFYPGLEAGYGWDIGSVLLGVNGFGDWHTNSVTGDDFGADVKLGFPMGKYMPYAKLGKTGSGSPVRWNGALGVEYKFAPQWSAAGELFTDSVDVNGRTISNTNISVGVSYHFPEQ